MTENYGASVQYLLNKVKELEQTIEAHMLEINKDIQQLYTEDLRLVDKIYEVDARVEDLEKSK